MPKELTPEELALIAGSIRLSANDEEDGGEIVVTGVRPPSPPPPVVWGPTPQPTPSPPPVTGVTPAPSASRKVADYATTCSSPSGAAVDIAKRIMGQAVAGPPNPLMTPEGRDWTTVEFGTSIAPVAGGGFGAVNNAIYSNNQPGFTVVPHGGPQAPGLLHSHPTRGSAAQQMVDRYPSDRVSGGADWEGLQDFADKTGTSNPSLWILGPDGTVREFPLSERGRFQGLSQEQMEAGQGLPGTERNNPC